MHVAHTRTSTQQGIVERSVRITHTRASVRNVACVNERIEHAVRGCIGRHLIGHCEAEWHHCIPNAEVATGT